MQMVNCWWYFGEIMYYGDVGNKARMYDKHF